METNKKQLVVVDELLAVTSMTVIDLQAYLDKATEKHGSAVHGMTEFVFLLVAIATAIKCELTTKDRLILLKEAASLELEKQLVKKL